MGLRAVPEGMREGVDLAKHELIAGPDTVHWGYYDAKLPPVMKIASGDTLVVHTESGRSEFLWGR